YDSVELASSLAWFAPLYEPGESARSSRSAITWDGVIRARERLIDSGVCAIVGAVPPPSDEFKRVEQVGRVWIAWLVAKAWADSESRLSRLNIVRGHGWARLAIEAPCPDRLVIRETWIPGWTARMDGEPVRVQSKSGVFLAVDVPAGRHELRLEYEPA